jgi:hypothetical protein
MCVGACERALPRPPRLPHQSRHPPHVPRQVCGIVNDTGILLDHLENLESVFAETVKSESARGFGTPRWSLLCAPKRVDCLFVSKFLAQEACAFSCCVVLGWVGLGFRTVNVCAIVQAWCLSVTCVSVVQLSRFCIRFSFPLILGTTRAGGGDDVQGSGPACRWMWRTRRRTT